MFKKTLNKVRENKKGFTLAELLIVVAIIAVLVAISIPIFTTQLEKSREATDAANVRSAYAEVVAAALEDPDTNQSVSVDKVQTVDGWANTSIKNIAGVDISKVNSKSATTVTYTASTGVVAIDGTNVTE